ncbi:MAG: DUF2071 domain-containing protein [Chthoniobacteraceae bacterium]
MRLPVIEGVIKRRILVNYRVSPDVIQRLLPSAFRPKLHDGHAIAGICLIRLEQIRPAGLPAFLGLSSENAAHRISIEWTDSTGEEREGVYIPRRDSGSLLNSVSGGRIFPGEHHRSDFNVSDDGNCIDLVMRSRDRAVEVKVRGRSAATLPSSSCFASLESASSFFRPGALGFSTTRDCCRLDGLRLETQSWKVESLELDAVYSSYFENLNAFPSGSAAFDHALIMRNIPHLWHQTEDLLLSANPSTRAPIASTAF